MKNQLQDYMLLNNGRGTAEFLIANEINVAFVDQATDLEIWLFMSPTKVSQLFVDSDADFDAMMALLAPLYGEENALGQVQLGEHRWVTVREKTENAEFLLYYVIKKGLRVAMQIRGAEITPEMIAFLDSIGESIAFPAAE